VFYSVGWSARSKMVLNRNPKRRQLTLTVRISDSSVPFLALCTSEALVLQLSNRSASEMGWTVSNNLEYRPYPSGHSLVQITPRPDDCPVTFCAILS